MRPLRRPLAIATASVGTGALLVTGGFLGLKAFHAAEERERRAASCTLISETESLYANQRKELAGRAPEVAFLGDSYSEGLYIGTPLEAFPYVLAKELDAAIAVNGVGGSGYVAGGPCGDQQLATRLDAVLQTKPKILVVQAGINDRGKAGVQDAALDLFERAQEISPRTKVVVLGPFAPAGAAGTELDAVAQDIHAAAQAAEVTFVDPRSWNYPLLPDGLHPTETGHEVIAGKLAAVLPVTR